MPTPHEPLRRERLRAVLFDLDGTLVDSIPFLIDCFGAASRQVLDLTPEHELIRSMVGLPLRAMFERVCPNLTDDAAARCMEAYKLAYRPHLAARSPLFPDARAVIERLYDQEIALGIVTGKTLEGLHRVLDPLDVLNYFGALVGADHGGLPKPAADGALYAAELLGVSPAETLVVGDSLLDVEMGLAAGMTVCGITTGTYSRTALSAHAHFVIDRLEELPSTLSVHFD